VSMFTLDQRGSPALIFSAMISWSAWENREVHVRRGMRPASLKCQ